MVKIEICQSLEETFGEWLRKKKGECVRWWQTVVTPHCDTTPWGHRQKQLHCSSSTAIHRCTGQCSETGQRLRRCANRRWAQGLGGGFPHQMAPNCPLRHQNLPLCRLSFPSAILVNRNIVFWTFWNIWFICLWPVFAKSQRFYSANHLMWLTRFPTHI